MLMGLEGLRAVSFEGEGGTLGDSDRLSIVSKSMRLKVIHYARA